jgi:flavodoxin I
MNVLITYFSQTGNTEHIARAIYEEASACTSALMKKIGDLAASSLNEYNLIFIGSPCHAGTLAAPVREMLSLLPDNPSFHLSGFITHASSVYDKSDYENCMTYLSSLCRKKGISYQGCFECRGRLAPQLHEYIRKSKHVTDEEWDRMVSDMNRHPDSEDVAKARKFARSVIEEITV